MQWKKYWKNERIVNSSLYTHGEGGDRECPANPPDARRVYGYITYAAARRNCLLYGAVVVPQRGVEVHTLAVLSEAAFI